MEKEISKRKGIENLIPMNKRTKDERRKLGQKAGEASGEARRKKKRLREYADLFGRLPAPERARRVMSEFVSESI